MECINYIKIVHNKIVFKLNIVTIKYFLLKSLKFNSTISGIISIIKPL